MNKKLLAVAVAGVFTAAPLSALAQSSVTISGFFKGSFDHHSIKNAVPTRTGNKSETRVSDHSSRMLFNVVEDLGGGMRAVAQYDLRFATDAAMRVNAPDATGAANTSSIANAVSSGNAHVGISSNTWGNIKVGRQDTHYGNTGDTIAGKGALWLHSSSLFDNVMRPGATVNAIASTSRTPNLMWYDSPKWGGFTFMIGYSTNPTAVSGTQQAENDLGTSGRKGSGWTFNPVYNGGNWEIAWSHWEAKSDYSGMASSGPAFVGTVNPVPNEKSDSIRGHYIWGGLRAGLAYNDSKLKNAVSGNTTGQRSAWSLPVSYNMGPHTFYGTYTKANNSKDVQAAPAVGTTAAQAFVAGAETGAAQFALAYAYDLSKRTSVSVNYLQLKNKSAGRYSPFYVSENVMGGTNTGSQVGEDHTMWGVVLRHGF